jgi:uncharacterized membrane protein
MSGSERPYGLLTDLSSIEETRNPARQRNLPAGACLAWLAAGWRDLWTQPGPSLAYGVAVFLVSAALVWTLFAFGLDYILFPALAGFMIVGPVAAVGLYEKSRILETGGTPSLGTMLSVWRRAGAQVFFTGLLLCLLMLLWMRAAVLIYALFFGVRPFPGLDHITQLILTTPMGLAMLVVGSAIGGLFAAFGFAISVFSIPMLLDKPVDALTAMGTSMAMVWNNVRPMIVWGLVVLILFAIGVLTGFLGLIVVFPLLGHATWHAYKAMR